jgi:LysM repeat protein
MKRLFLCCISLLLLAPSGSRAQDGYAERVKKYVSQYYAFAIEEQRTKGIPACITLGQGILETEAGASELVSGANNHFGIKCTNNWNGETFAHSDDRPNECFKKYSCAAESYKDHSDHLKRNPRYAQLFTLSQTDYASWAICLKKCGYATNPQYAQKLIRIIEDFKLQQYTYSALDSTFLGGNGIAQVPTKTESSALYASAAADARNTVVVKEPVAPLTTAKTDSSDAEDATVVVADFRIDSSKLVTINGMKAFYAYQDEILLPYAVKYHIRYPRLLEMNDLQDGPLPFNTYVYIEKKLTYGLHEQHTVEFGENLLMISQLEGLQLKKLMALNLLNPNEEPLSGTVLELQKPALKKPDVSIKEITAHKGNAIISTSNTDPRESSDYIQIKKAKPAPVADTTRKAAVASGTEADQKNINAATDKQATAKVEKPVTLTKPEPVAAEEGDEEDNDLASLKADLDKVVYADDTKLKNGQPRNAAQAKKAATEPGTTEKYTIKRGENLSVIARRNNVTVKQLLAWNDVEPDEVRAGDKLIVTDPGKTAPAERRQESTKPKDERLAGNSSKEDKYYVIQKGETVSAIARKNHITVNQLLKWNDIEPDKIRDGKKLRVRE